MTIALAVGLAVAVSAAPPEIRSFTFGGTITELTSGPGPVMIGDGYVVRYIFNADEPDKNPLPSVGYYPNVIGEAIGTVGPHPLAYKLIGEIGVQNNGSFGDVYEVLCSGATSMAIYMADAEAGAFASDELPTDLNLPAFEYRVLAIHVHGSFGHWGASGPITGFVAAGTCYPDCTGDDALTIADFACFQAAFVAGSVYADCTLDAQRTIADFACFQAAFVAGCP